MSGSGAVLAGLAAQFALLSLLAFGGANAVVPEVHRQAVSIHHWMGEQDFAALFAISQAAPGPNVLICTLVGWRVAGVAGALIVTLAMCGPSCLLTYGVAKVWDRHRDAPWRAAIGAGLAPVAVGLVLATAYLLARAADSQWRLAAVTVVSAAVSWITKWNPLWCLGAAAALGAAGAFS